MNPMTLTRCDYCNSAIRTDSDKGSLYRVEGELTGWYFCSLACLATWAGDDGLAERIARLADTLAHTNGWTPPDAAR